MHESRLNRRKSCEDHSFGSHDYSREELVAEMGAAFLCGFAGIEQATIENSAAYIASWRKKLQDDPKCLVVAAAQAQKAADYILCVKAEDKTEDPTA
jgi:antirestriction protein ArdC